MELITEMPLYIGVRVEVANRLINMDKLKTYNRRFKTTRIFDITDNGRITVEKSNQMIIARGKRNEKGSNGLVNFSLMTKSDATAKEEVERIVKIVNCLGNERLIRERVHTFVHGRSLLNNLPELKELKVAFNNLEELMPGFIEAGWYYAPEALFE
jgi:uncharacterized FAD-dependent dehydrogenase